MYLPVWQLCVLAVLLVGLLGVAMILHQRVQCLRYCLWMLSFHTPEGQREQRIRVNAALMANGGMKPTEADRHEPHPFGQTS